LYISHHGSLANAEAVVRFDMRVSTVAEDALCGILDNVILCRLDRSGGKVRQVKLQSLRAKECKII